MDNPTSTCWLLGHPVSHSLSPLIHNTAFTSLNMAVRYEALDVEPNEVGKAITRLDGITVLGANVTIPLKQAVIPFLDELTNTAARVGAVNTIYIQDKKRIGHNTDVEGFLAPLETMSLDGSNMVVLGSGGAARAVLVALSTRFRPAQITLVSRQAQKAQVVCDDLGVGRAATYDQLESLVGAAHLVVNTTPVGMTPNTQASPIPPNIRFRDGQTVYDLIYIPSETQLLKQARADGAHCIGGLPMLVAQAAASFRIWTGQNMPTEIVEKALMDHLQNG